MKRKTKNIITIILISVLLVCMYFTVINNVSNNQNNVQNNQMGGMMSQGEPPEKPGDSSENSAKSIKLVLDKTSKIKLTGDSYVSSLEDEDSSYDNIDFNGYKLYVNGTAIN